MELDESKIILNLRLALWLAKFDLPQIFNPENGKRKLFMSIKFDKIFKEYQARIQSLISGRGAERRWGSSLVLYLKNVFLSFLIWQKSTYIKLLVGLVQQQKLFVRGKCRHGYQNIMPPWWKSNYCYKHDKVFKTCVADVLT